MTNLVNFIKDNYKTIIGTILIYQLFITIFFFSAQNLVILAAISILVAGYIIVLNFKDASLKNKSRLLYFSINSLKDAIKHLIFFVIKT